MYIPPPLPEEALPPIGEGVEQWDICTRVIAALID